MRVRAAAGLVAAGLTLGLTSARAADAPLAEIALAQPFGARTDWRLVATQAPPIRDPVFDQGDVPGAITLCLATPRDPCAEPLEGLPPDSEQVPDGIWDKAHTLEAAEIVWPGGQGAAPLLLLRTASLGGANGDRYVWTRLFAYHRAGDRFAPVFAQATGRNNNQEIRYIRSGPLRGAVVVAEPTERAPFVFWVTVNRLTSARTYKPVLRYRSATRYADGNRLAVIDSEMPNIQRRLGLWRAGQPLPLPAGACPQPHLVRTELWCD